MGERTEKLRAAQHADEKMTGGAATHGLTRADVQAQADLVRNREVGRWLEEDQTQYLLMIDSDMVPVPETAAILVEEGGVVWCPYVDQAGHPIDRQKQGVGTDCLRVSRRFISRVIQPWFLYQLDGCRGSRVATQGRNQLGLILGLPPGRSDANLPMDGYTQGLQAHKKR